MSNIYDVISPNEKIHTLKYYGANDLSTGHDISSYVDSCSAIIEYFHGELHPIDSLDSYVDYLFLLKLSQFEEILSDIRQPAQDEVMRPLVTMAKSKLIRNMNSSIIIFLQSNWRSVFDKNSFLDLDDVSIKLCEKLQSGLQEDFFFNISSNYPLKSFIILKAFINCLKRTRS